MYCRQLHRDASDKRLFLRDTNGPFRAIEARMVRMVGLTFESCVGGDSQETEGSEADPQAFEVYRNASGSWVAKVPRRAGDDRLRQVGLYQDRPRAIKAWRQAKGITVARPQTTARLLPRLTMGLAMEQGVIAALV